MAGLKISELTELTSPTGEEELVYASEGVNGKIKLKNVGGGMSPTLLGTISEYGSAVTFNKTLYSFVMMTNAQQNCNNTHLYYIADMTTTGIKHYVDGNSNVAQYGVSTSGNNMTITGFGYTVGTKIYGIA